MQNLTYPLHFQFKVTTLSSDFTITDNVGNSVGYVRQKLFKLREEVQIFENESRENQLFTIKANQWLDFNASYSVSDRSGNFLGQIARRGMRSFWKATYDIINETNTSKYKVQEKNPWIKMMDGLIDEIPLIGMFSGYFLNPTYTVTDQNGREIFLLKKQPSFWGRKFQLEKTGDPDNDETLVILSLMMMILLERERG